MRAESGRVLIFGGTTEGRIAAERLLHEGVPCTVSVATHYGEEVLAPHPLMRVRTGRLDRAKMAQLMREEQYVCVIDATHPHAKIVSEEIASACGETGLPCLRLQRRMEDQPAGAEGCGRPAIVHDIDEAAAFLASVPGHILVTTGSKELVRFVRALGDPSRVTARVLPAQESLRLCGEAGLAGKQIFAMQGPFDVEMNCAQIRHAGADWLLTKETGEAGGYPEKMEAAKRCGIRSVVIRASAKEQTAEQGSNAMDLDDTIEAALRFFDERSGSSKRVLFLVGIGTGSPKALTLEAQEAIASARVLFGAGTVLQNLTGTPGTRPMTSGKTVVPIYDSEGILRYLSEHPQIRTAAVAYSGDSGFYSGAASMLAALRASQEREGGGTAPSAQPAKAAGYDVRLLCGISCVSWFSSRAGIPWQDWKILSSHGRFCNVIGQVRRNRECFLLLSGVEQLRRTGEQLADAQERGVLGSLRLLLGYELSRPAQEIRECSAEDLAEAAKEGLYVLYIRHEDADRTPVLPGLPDSAFIRGKAPMTSSEIRALSLCRLGLTAGAVLWDVGAGTGSVSIEAALTCPDGRVWSVECREEALALLAENRSKSCLRNMEIIRGRAPEVLKDLPAPTHVFIGGSGGEIGEILRAVLERNPGARVVANCITSETLAALKTALETLPVRDLQCMQVIVNREEKLGRYHCLRAANPVFIISFAGDGR